MFRARVEKVVDADTSDVTVDAAFRNTRTERLRLLGVNAPEIKGPTRGDGLLAQIYVEDWLDDAEGEWPLTVQTH